MTNPSLTAAPIQRYLERLHADLAAHRTGAVAAYIPELARVDPDQFAIAIAAVDGHLYQVGDSQQRFTIQSISKPLVYGLALAEHGVEAVLTKVGVEPSGEAFNSISLEPETGRPLNPMINAGAIAVSSLIGGADAAAREQRILDCFARYTGRTMEIDAAVYASEARTGHRNRALAHLMRNFGIIEGDPEPGLDLYFRQCAVQVDCCDLALMAACLANQGVNPRTGERALGAEDVVRVLSVMASCGMYDYSGGWLYRVGMPAKSGVGGGIIAVLPGQVGLAVFSPRLDARGNSCRGIAVCEQLAADFDLHLFHTGRATAAAVIRARFDAAEVSSGRRRRRAERELLAAEGHRILVYELQGELGIGAAESLVHALLDRLAGVDTLILALGRVRQIDQAAARLLADLARDIATSGRTLLLPGADRQPALLRAIEALGPVAADGPPRRFGTLDQALAWAEDRLLEQQAPGLLGARATALADNDLCQPLAAADRERLAALATRVTFAAGAVVFGPGDAATSLFLIASGQFEVQAPVRDAAPRHLATLGPGMVFGELSLATGAPRTTRVQASSAGVCWQVPFAAIDAALAARLLAGIATRLAERLTAATRALELLG